MLTAAGVQFEVLSPAVDEEEIRRALVAEKAGPRAMADALAEAKAVKISRRIPGALVLGSDQILALDDGTTFDKAGDRATLAAQLRRLRGGTHRLVSAAVIAESGHTVWRHVDIARLTMRDFSDAFIEQYLDAEGSDLFGCVGGYRIEGLGAQLFTRVHGSHFTVRGLPLLEVLEYLRVRGLLTT